MSDEKKISRNEDIFLAELEASRTGEEHDLSSFEESGNLEKNQVLGDLEQISNLFRGARPDIGEIPESTDDIILGHIRQKSREIRRERKVVRLFPVYKWAATAVVGMLVCVISYSLIYKTDNIKNSTFIKGSDIQTELSDKVDRNDIKEAPDRNLKEFKTADYGSESLKSKRLEENYSSDDLMLLSTAADKYISETDSKKVSETNKKPQFATQWNTEKQAEAVSAYIDETSRNTTLDTNLKNTQLVKRVGAVNQSEEVSGLFADTKMDKTPDTNLNNTLLTRQMMGAGSQPEEDSRDIDGNGKVNIIDAYLMDRRLMSGVALPKKLDFNGDGNINHEDINTILKTAVSLGKGEV